MSIKSKDIELCRYFLNGNRFRNDYPFYSLAIRHISRDKYGVPDNLSDTASKMVLLISAGFREAVSKWTKALEDNGDPILETLTLETGKTLAASYPELYAMVQLSKQVVNDDFQVEITVGLLRLLGDIEDAFVFMSLCRSIYIFWNYPPMQGGFDEKELQVIDGLQRYLNGALWTWEKYVSAAEKL